MLIKTPGYILRTCNSNMTSRDGFQWPESGLVKAPDWKPTKKCGNGLHGLLWGEGDGRLLLFDPDARWIVAKVEEYIDLGGKVKFPRAEVVFVGDRIEATNKIIELGARGPVVGANVTVGDKMTAVVGYKGTATAGDDGTATAGRYGTAIAGYCGTARAGDYGTATAGGGGTAKAGDLGTATAGIYGTATAGIYGTARAGAWGTATAGNYGTATAGYEGTARADYKGTAIVGDKGTATVGRYGTAQSGENGIIQIEWYDGKRSRIAVGYVGEDGIKPDTLYKCENGKLVEVEE